MNLISAKSLTSERYNMWTLKPRLSVFIVWDINIESKVGHWPYLCFIGSLGSVQQPKKSGKDSRKSAVIRKRLSELTRTIGQQSMDGETDLGDKENQMSLLMNEAEDLLQDMSLTEN